MAFTSTDLAQIEAAILALGSGSRTVSVTIGDKMIQYGKADIAELMKLKSDIEMSLGYYPARTYAKQGGRGR